MITELAKKLIHENEGDRLKVYRDSVGILTIGRGRNLEDRGITQDESDYLLQNDVERAITALKSSYSFYRGLDPARQAVMIDMYHNLGGAGLNGFKKMLAALRVKDYDEAARQIQDSRYWNQVGVRAQRNYCMMRFGRAFTREEARAYFEEQHFGI